MRDLSPWVNDHACRVGWEGGICVVVCEFPCLVGGIFGSDRFASGKSGAIISLSQNCKFLGLAACGG